MFVSAASPSSFKHIIFLHFLLISSPCFCDPLLTGQMFPLILRHGRQQSRLCIPNLILSHSVTQSSRVSPVCLMSWPQSQERNAWRFTVPRPPVCGGITTSVQRSAWKILSQTLEFFCNSVAFFRCLLYRNIY